MLFSSLVAETRNYHLGGKKQTNITVFLCCESRDIYFLFSSQGKLQYSIPSPKNVFIKEEHIYVFINLYLFIYSSWIQWHGQDEWTSVTKVQIWGNGSRKGKPREQCYAAQKECGENNTSVSWMWECNVQAALFGSQATTQSQKKKRKKKYLYLFFWNTFVKY